MLWISIRSKRCAAVEGGDLAGGAGEEAGVALEVGAGAAARLARRGAVQADLPGPDRAARRRR